MRTRIEDPDYPLGIKGKDFLEKVYLEMIAWMTVTRNLKELFTNAQIALGPGEHINRVTTAYYTRLVELDKQKRGIF